MAELGTSDVVAGNFYDKYRSRNPIHKSLLAGFLKHARRLLDVAAPANIVEVGCGPGDLAARLFGRSTNPDVDYAGVDICEQQVQLARSRYPEFRFAGASAYHLPFDDDTVDVVLLCEVLEHLDDPAIALSEAFRVSREFILISVPWEPVWRVLNVLRGKYWSKWGNTPGHIQHFSRRAIRDLVSRQFDIVAVRHPLPWTMILAKKKTV